MDTHIERLATAALLHDIGKFWSRTGRDRPYTSQESEHFSTYAHALWSAHFIEQHIRDVEMAGWVRLHHRPDSREACLVSLADWLSSGEREKDEDQPTGRPEAATLVSVLSQVRSDGQAEQAPPQDWRLPLVRHGAFGEGFMPQPGIQASAEDYRVLWDAFEAEVRAARPETAPHGTWLALLRRFCSRVPAATPTTKGAYVPDISLYDHSRTTAAIASCMAAGGTTHEQAGALRTVLSARQEGHAALSEPICRLACGDLSGIQEFLYTLTSAHAAKTLRGRSFALQLVADACVAHICERTGVPPSCVLYNGGGRFYLLLPLDARVNALAADLGRHVHHAFEGGLTVQLGSVDLAPADFAGSAMTAKWRAAGEAAAAEKRRRYTRLAAEDYDAVFGAFGRGGARAKCEVCGKELGEASPAGEGAEGDRLCEDCQAYVDLGQRLRYANWLVRCKTEEGEHAAAWNRLCSSLGFTYRVVSGRDELPAGCDIVEAVQLGDFNIAETRRTLALPEGVAVGYRQAARAWPRNDDDEIMTFKELAKASRGIQKLGVFRADVDGLGGIFSTGLGERATVSRVASLSSSLSDFFEGYVPYLIDQQYGGALGVIYAGGDDLFVVGGWSQTIEFALELRAHFAAYACRNPALTFSGGVVVVDDHLPVRYAADMAAEAEESAKAFERNGLEKNALSLFGTVLGFEEIGRFRDFHELLVTMLEGAGGEKRPMPASFLRRLYDIWEVYQRERRAIERRTRGQGTTLDALKREAQWQRWRWMLTYGLREFTKKHEDWKQQIADVQERLLETGMESIEDRLGVPLRWTELLLRKE
jgi:CRISPR-associated protein Csm1